MPKRESGSYIRTSASIRLDESIQTDEDVIFDIYETPQPHSLISRLSIEHLPTLLQNHRLEQNEEFIYRSLIRKSVQ